MTTVDEGAAKEIARAHVVRLSESVGEPCALVPSETREVEQGWLFFFNTAEFVQSRDPMHSLAGNGPFLVLRDGRVHELPSSLPLEEALKHI